jgi:hypothetical protein
MRPLKKSSRLSTIAWPSFQGEATLVGKSPSGNVSVYVDASESKEALANASALLGASDRISEANARIFGVKPLPVNVILFALGGATDGTGGADHMGCDFINGGNLEVDLSIGSLPRVAALFEAELSECCMNGNLCGSSTGEALSRWCAAAISGNALKDFASAPIWQSYGMVNWVDYVEDTDQNYDSIGCGMTALSLVLLSYGLDQVAQAMVSIGDQGTLSDLWHYLTESATSNLWQILQNRIQSLPGGKINDDDPFGAMAKLNSWLCV